MDTINGSCHCGNIQFDLDTSIAPADIKARACDCRFCRIHGAQNWSDPDGSMVWRITDVHHLCRYRFALRTADFYICKVCGAYAGAVLQEQERAWSVLNLRLTGIELVETVTSFGAENAADRIARRRRVWTPTTFAQLMDMGPYG